MNTKSNKNNHEVVIPDDLANERLDQALAKLLPEYSRTQLKQWIEKDQVTINGSVQKAKTRVRSGDRILVQPTLRPEPAWEAQNIPLNIVYEDEAVIIINKPAGLVVHPGAGNASATMLNALLHHEPALKALPRAGILHRLDKDTSGLLIVAKTLAALKSLSQQLKHRTLSREYQTVVYGSLISGGKVDAPIDRHPVQRKRMAIVDTGKPAITHYRIMEKYRGLTRLKVKLETGRTHQIRVHMSHIRHPIAGDVQYGGRVQLVKGMSEELIQCLRQFKRQALHAFAVGFTHPVSGEWMDFEAEIPEDMQELISALRKDAEKM
ncbi:MAG TPA: 23S rRNA pseudouridine(1911/1915/1917) synthase RluD [Gammaproteobacteria bacterium]|jgi:23S rRNA pseudouridine1911/1915/1917 synthase|nr:23S rRNA pseudouridine(1911/1915/1917) synthase RluD [Gammaproteobacteria bacterium]